MLRNFCLLAGLALVGCGSAEGDADPGGARAQAQCPDAPRCEPGKSVACTCADGSTSAQVCADDGSKWLECQCDSSAIDPDSVCTRVAPRKDGTTMCPENMIYFANCEPEVFTKARCFRLAQNSTDGCCVPN